MEPGRATGIWRWLCAIAFAFVAMVSSVPVNAQIIGGGTVFRREYHRDEGDMRLAAQLWASDERDPYWAWLGTSQEELRMPNAGRAALSFILVNRDGKPVKYGRWSPDQSRPKEEWQPLVSGPNGFEMEVDLARARVGIHTIHFIGGIKDGERNYTKLFVLVDFTRGGKRKTAYLADALQFKVYRLDRQGPVDGQTLAGAQQAMGAGGSSLIGPIIADAGNGRPNELEQPAAAERQVGMSGVVEVTLTGFSSWVRLENQAGQSVGAFVDGSKLFQLPNGTESFNCFIAQDQGDPGVRILNNGRLTPFDATTRRIQVVKEKKG